MANPQLKNGHTRIANEILGEIMRLNLNGTQFRLVLAIWRYTYGFQRKTNEMSINFLAKVINASRTQTNRELATLIDRNIISVFGIGSKGARIMGFNKDYKEWDEQLPPNEVEPEIPDQTKPVKKNKYDEENTYYKMAVYFHEKVSVVANEAGISHLIKKSNMQSWADDMRKLIEIDQVDKHLAKQVMDWVTQDSFWRTNVLSAKKLRDKFVELAIKMNADKKPSQQKQKPQYDPRDKEIEFQRWLQDGNDPNDFDWSN
ncbi:gp45 [Lysinibacillus capsici]|uniref:Gp45 n=1 Tax=Lysinibacillus capsici TaxID=2115968 RepID=A0A2X0YZN9_9BACI|nr:replication protein [Lysinibacillus capsici]SPT95581.1 gp45 [Lysinibacillus capsici]